jgi:hypothetical protein
MAEQLKKSQWGIFFDRITSVLLTGKRAEIEVASLKLGDQIEAEWLPLLGISYDPKDEVLDVSLEGHDHLIRNPREIYVEAQGLDLSSMEVIDADGTRHIVILRDPLALPAPSASADAAADAAAAGR